MTTFIVRHPDDATLMSYAAGGLNEALSAAVAAHIAICPRCRDEVANMELMGEAMLLGPALARGEPVAVPPAPPVRRARPSSAAEAHDDPLPLPLVRRYGLTMRSIPWRLLAPGIMQHRLQVADGEGDLRLLKIASGLRMPEHGHGGTELTLVLDGAYSDVTGDYRRGDVQDVGEDVEHRPYADPALGCVCLIASEKPARFKGLLGRIIPPLTGL